MLFSKLRSGVLCLDTPLGTRYLRPNFKQRVQLLWVFRHFSNVPVTVLTRPQVELIERLRAEGEHVHVEPEVLDVFLLGTIEFAKTRVELPERKAPQRAVAAASSATGSFIGSRNVRAAQER